MKKLLALLSILALVTCRRTDTPYVLLVSFDGFRHDYVEKYDAPNFKALIREGSAADALIPSFPSLTFANHYTLVTGLYPGHHGIVSNRFFSREHGAEYSMNDSTSVCDPYYYGGTPLWQLAQEQGLKSASYFWVGSEAPVHGRYADYWLPYNGDVFNDERITKVMEWFRLPEDRRPHFISLYFSFTDHIGHEFGPNSEEMKNAVHEADRLLGRIEAELRHLDIPVNLIVVSDHGMYEMNTDERTHVYLNELIPEGDSGFVASSSSGFMLLYFDDSTRREEAYRSLRAEDRLTVYRKAETPESWHYRDHPSIGDLIVVSKPGHYVTVRRPGKPSDRASRPWGTHGFDPGKTSDMNGIFYGRGPNIKSGSRLTAFENIHVYPFIARILGLSIPEIDGNPSVLEPIYVDGGRR
jgi:alkaline phosphatase D